MRPFDWLVVVAYIGWIIIDGLRRSKGTDKVDGYLLANRSLPWWAVGLSVMATQMSAVTIVGTTGLAYTTGLRFIQNYFPLPLAMVILSLTVVPFFTRARVYTAYEYLERRFDVRVRSLASFLFLIGRATSLGVTLAAPSVVMSAILGWSLPVTVLVICIPMIAYTTIGGVQAVAWTDVKQMFIVVFGMSAAVSDPALRHPAARQLRPGASPRRRHRPAQGRGLQLQPQRDLHVLVGDARRHVPDAVLLRLRSEPGAALSDRQVDRRGAAIVDDERVGQDPAAAADPGDRRPRVRVLPVQHAADAVQPRLRRAGRGGPARGGIRRAAAGVRRGGGGPRPRRHGGGPDGVPRERHATQGDPDEGARRRQAGDRRRQLQRRQLRLSRRSSPPSCRSGSSG